MRNQHTIDQLDLATKSAVALIDIVCQYQVSQAYLPPEFGALGALVCGSLEEASAEAVDRLRLTTIAIPGKTGVEN